MVTIPLVPAINMWAQDSLSGVEEKAHDFTHTVMQEDMDQVLMGKLWLGRIKRMFRRHTMFSTQYSLLFFCLSSSSSFLSVLWHKFQASSCCARLTQDGWSPSCLDSETQPLLSALSLEPSSLRIRNLSQVHFRIIFNMKFEAKTFLWIDIPSLKGA